VGGGGVIGLIASQTTGAWLSPKLQAGIGGKLFVFGGVDPDDKFTTDTLMLDVGAGSKTWKTLSPMSRGMAEFGYAARMINGKWEIYVGGVYVLRAP